MPYATVSFPVTVDLDHLSEKVDLERLKDDDEYVEHIQDIIIERANRILEETTIHAIITDSSENTLVD